MIEKIRKLSVMIPARDRLILTEKCIDSIWKHSNLFQQIQIYVFDNKSDLIPERFSLFNRLLKENRIQYYSYDTSESTMLCFGKAITFNRWIDMMKMEKDVYDHVPEPKYRQVKNYYLLLDNDFILGPKWDQYFISTCDYARKIEKNCKFIVKLPGGIPSRHRNGPEYPMQNLFNNDETFMVKSACGGGSSGMWFMDYKMLMDMRWDNEYIATVFNINKRHDTNSWNHIRRKFGASNYVIGLKAPEEYPLCLHLGGQTGSVCNQLRRRTYDENKESIRKAELHLRDMNCDEIFENFKDVAKNW